MDDGELLDAFVKQQSQSAFRELVERHLPVVYSAARRMVRDPHLAEEVAQIVFTTLARKAASIRPPQVISGWLYNTTRHLAMHAIRTEQRRREREQTAFAMQSLDADPNDTMLAEHLEPAMSELDADDRDALVLRYLANRGLREVGVELGISEEAARKRVSRAVDRLRSVLERRGVSVTSVLLATTLVSSTVAVPAGLSATITTTALTPVAGTLATATSTTLKWLSFKTVTAMLLGVVVVGTGMSLVLQDKKLPIANSRPTPRTGGLITGILKTPEGQPLSGAEVYLSTASASVPVYGEPSPKVQSTVTGADGRFSFPQDAENRAVIVLNEKGYGQITVTELAQQPELILQRWAHIEGTLRQGKAAKANQTIHLSRTRFGSKLEERAYRTVHNTVTTTDAEGRYVFDRVAPGDTWISWRSDKGGYDVQYRYLDAQPGQSLTVDIGGTGRAVVGRAVLVDAEGNAPVKFYGSVWPNTLHQMKRPPNWSELSTDEQETLTAAWEKTADAKIYNQEKCPIDFRIAPDGTFTVPDLPVGGYRLVVMTWTGAPVTSQRVSRGQARVMIEEMPGGRSDEPLDIGTVEAFYSRPLRVGDMAPLFEASTIAGEPFKLAACKGKYVLLNFWRSDRPEIQEEMEHLKTVQNEWNQDKRFILVGLNFDFDVVTTRNYVATQRLNWTHCPLDKASNLPMRYRIQGPTTVLIGPDGRILEPDLHGDDIAAAVRNALAKK